MSRKLHMVKGRVKTTARKKFEGAGNVGTGYSSDSILNMLKDLESPEQEIRVHAATAFATYHQEMEDELAQMPESERFMEKFVQETIRDMNRIIEQLITENRKQSLQYLAQAKRIPVPVRERARIALQQLPKKKPIGIDHIQQWMQELKGPKGMQVKTAVQMLRRHPTITRMVAETPGINITRVNQLLVWTVERHTAPIIRQLQQKGAILALKLLAQSQLFSLPIQRQAQIALEQVTGKPDTKKEEPIPIQAKGEPLHQAPITRQEMSPIQVQQMVTALGSPRKEEQIRAAIRVVNNHHALSKAVGKIPDVNITQVNRRLVGIIERNLQTVLQRLRQQKMKKALRFLANSHLFNLKVQREAMGIFVMVFRPSQKKKPNNATRPK